jgi:hypothetical protein
VADLGPALVTGSATLVGVVAGAGLTYWLGALNRRHQEQREDKTRWYEARLRAYAQLIHAIDGMDTVIFLPKEPPPELREETFADLRSAESMVHLVGSPDAYNQVELLLDIAADILSGPRPPKDEDQRDWVGAVDAIKHLARMELGYPDTLFKSQQVTRGVEQQRKKRFWER